MRGARGEQLAARHLKRQGYRILGRNLRRRHGEIDLLAEAPPPEGTLVVVEVKTGTIGQTPPEHRVNRTKQTKLIALATQLARQRGLTGCRFRFDIVAVELPPDGGKGKPVLRHLPGAFESRW